MSLTLVLLRKTFTSWRSSNPRPWPSCTVRVSKGTVQVPWPNSTRHSNKSSVDRAQPRKPDKLRSEKRASRKLNHYRSSYRCKVESSCFECLASSTGLRLGRLGYFLLQVEEIDVVHADHFHDVPV